MRNRTLAMVHALGVLGGCGGAAPSVALNEAASRVEEARILGAEQLAPYEYDSAKEHLAEAEVEASRASYSNAVQLAVEAGQHADEAIARVHETQRAQP
ncbi:MAG: DUF4398 domain-containing protein [Polyangiaceae bacterium]|jgi:hypothetical protein